MRITLLSFVAVLVLVAPTLTAEEAFTLELQLFHDETLVASPTVTSRAGEPGVVRLADLFDFTLTPTRLDDEQVRVSFEIRDGVRTLRPRMLVSHEAAGTVRWTHRGGDDEIAPIVEIHVALVRG